MAVGNSLEKLPDDRLGDIHWKASLGFLILTANLLLKVNRKIFHHDVRKFIVFSCAHIQ